MNQTADNGNSVRVNPDEASRGRFKTWLFVALFIAFAAVLAGSALFYTGHRDHLRQSAEKELTSIAELKASQISGWLDERLADANVLMERPSIVEGVRNLLTSSTQSDYHVLQTQLSITRERYRYEDILVVDTDGEIHLSLNEAADQLHEEALPYLAEAFADGSPVITNLHRDANRSPHLGVITPYFADAAADAPLGAVVLWISAEDFLFPLIQSWPVPSDTSETLLVRQEGDHVLFLNNLRFEEDAALTLSVPLERADVPAIMAVTGTEGIVRGPDYRGVPVVAALQAIPETGWFMVAKVDVDEVYSQWQTQAILIAVLTLTLLLVSGAVAAFAWQWRSHTETAALNTLLEQRVYERTAELQESNKELEAFAYSVSHDLRSPLRAIDGFSRIMLEEYEERLESEGKRLLQVIRRNAQQMDQLISNLLEMSRVGRMQMSHSRIDMEQLVRSAYDEAATEDVRDGFEFEVQSLPPADGDPVLLRLAFVNLLGNAIKFTMPSERHKIEVGGYIENGMKVYYVRDTGAGFDERYAGKMFHTFERLHATHEFPGTGIGLAIVARIARRHGGTVWARGEVGKGATFYFGLPARGG